MSKTNILIVGGRKLLREGLMRLLSEHADLRVVGESDSTETGVKLIIPLRVDVVLLNCSSSTQIGADLVRAIASSDAAAKVIVLAISPSPQSLATLLSAGARGCLTKECSSDELLSAIRAVASGHLFLSPKLTEMVVRGYAQPADVQEKLRPLAPREREVLCRIASGQTTKEIAYALGVSTKTIETHRRRIMEKLDLYSVAELTQYALREELIALGNPLKTETVVLS